MIFQLNETNPHKRHIQQIVDIMRDDGVILYPTDTLYAYGCDILSKKAIEKIYHLKRIEKNKPLSFVLSDIKQLHEYVRNISNKAFKVLKKSIPGPYTFIFQASKLVPKLVVSKQKTIGIRIPNYNVALDLVQELGRPMISASITTMTGEYITCPDELEKETLNSVDAIIDCGIKISEPSTIIDFSSGETIVVRKGKGFQNIEKLVLGE